MPSSVPFGMICVADLPDSTMISLPPQQLKDMRWTYCRVCQLLPSHLGCNPTALIKYIRYYGGKLGVAVRGTRLGARFA